MGAMGIACGPSRQNGGHSIRRWTRDRLNAAATERWSADTVTPAEALTTRASPGAPPLHKTVRESFPRKSPGQERGRLTRTCARNRASVRAFEVIVRIGT